MLLETKRVSWNNYRTILAAAQDTASWADDTDPAALRTNALMAPKALTLPPKCNSVTLRFRLGADTATFNYEVFAMALGDDPVHVTMGAGVAGKQASILGGVYADTLTPTDLWIKDVLTANGAGGDGMATVTFDCMGFQQIVVLGDSISAGNLEIDYKYI